MKHCSTFLLLTTLFSCNYFNPSVNFNEKKFEFPAIKTIEVSLPVFLGNIDIADSTGRGKLVEKNIQSKIEETIANFYFYDCSGDSAEIEFKIKDCYIQTLFIKDSLYDLYVVLLKDIAHNNQLTSKTLFYNTHDQKFIENTYSFNFQTLYHIKNKKLIPNNLRNIYKIETPEIEKIDFDSDGINEFKYTRINHTDSINKLETIVLKIENDNINTLKYDQTGFKN